MVRSTGETPATDHAEKSQKQQNSRNHSVFRSLLGNQSKNSKNSNNRVDSQNDFDFLNDPDSGDDSFQTGKY